jgi:hypothetical protein
MSLLHKIITVIRSDHTQQTIETPASAMPAANCLMAEVALVDQPERQLEKDDNDMKQRRYYVKTGLYVDHEEELLVPESAQAVIFDKPPTDLQSLFARLSLR